MAERLLTYRIGVNADTSLLQAALRDVGKSLAAVSELKAGNGITQDLTLAAKAAKELEQHLLNGLNPNTGKLDLSKFTASLKASGNDLSAYATKLQAIGPAGERAFLSVASAIAGAELPIVRTSKLMDSLWVTMRNTLRWLLTSSALRGFIGAILTTIGYAQDLDKSLNNIQIVTKKSTDLMKEFSKYANEAASKLSTTTTKYTDASLIYYQQGLSDEEVKARTDITVKLSNVAKISVEEASLLLTAIWNNFYDGTKSLEYYVDVMTKLGATTASSSSEISEGILKFAAVADTVGLSYEYAAAALTTITASTRESADIVGTSLRTLFGRIQSLKLGETLEDGTDLAKYSEALQKVGIDVKDASGELKDMDLILEEMGDTWKILTRSQLMALALTVGGIRQYSQLIALMDEWDFFKKSLQTAYDSEGELTEQSDTYAKGWEAARDRVKVAAEDIYGSLINEDFFIGFDNDLADFLHGIALVVDALGGMGGVLNLLALAFTNAFGDKLALGLRDIAYNFTVLTGEAERALMAIRQLAGEAALNMVANSAAMSNSVNFRATAIQVEDILMQNLLSSQAKKMTEELYKLLSNYKDIITKIREIGLESEKVLETNKKENAELVNNIKNLDEVKKRIVGYGVTTTLAQRLINKAGLNNVLLDVGYDVDNLINSYQLLYSIIGLVSLVKRQLQGIDPSNTEQIDSLKAKFTELSGIDLSTSTLGESINIIEEKLLVLELAAEMVGKGFTYGNISGEALASLQNYATLSGEAMLNAAHATLLAALEQEKYMLSVYNATILQKDWAANITYGANLLMRLGMMIQSIKTLGNIWDNEDMTTGQKMVQTLTSLGMILPTITSLIKLATTSTTKYISTTINGTNATNADIIAKALLEKLITGNVKATVVQTATIKSETVAVEDQTAAVIALNTAWYKNPTLWVVAAIATAVAAFTIYNTVIEENTKRKRENAQAEADSARDTANKIKEERENLNTLHTDYIALRAGLDSTEESKESLRLKTEELCEALGIERATVKALKGDYEALDKEIAEKNAENAEKAIDKTKTTIDKRKIDLLLSASDEIGENNYLIDFGANRGTDADSEVVQLILEALKQIDFDGNLIEGGPWEDWHGNNAVTKYEDLLIANITNGDEMFLIYEVINQAIENLSSEEYEKLQDSEIYQNIIEWIRNYKDKYDEIVQFNQDLTNYAEELAQAKGVLADASIDLSLIDSVEEYREYIDSYKKELRSVFEAKDIMPEELDGATEDLINEYFEKLAKKYLSGYDHLKDIAVSDEVINYIVENIGENNREIITRLVESGDYDLPVLLNLDWEVLGNSGDNLEKAIKDAYDNYIENMELTEFEEDVPVIINTISSLQQLKDLTDDLIQLLNKLESRYSGLAAIRNKNSALYILALKDIREGMEHVTSTLKMKVLNDAWGELINSTEEYNRATEDVFDASDMLNDKNISIDIDDSNFAQHMREIMDADYAVLVSIEADLESDINDIIAEADAMASAAGKIQEGFKIAYSDIQAVNDAFPGILAGYTVTTDGMILLNSDVAQSVIERAGTEINAEKESVKEQIVAYKQILLSKASAMRTIAEGLQELYLGEVEGAENTADAKAKIEQGVTDFKSSCADELGLISSNLAKSEINDANSLIDANDNAARISSNNWADAYDSMAQNSADWARISILNAKEVEEAMAAAKEGLEVVGTPVSGGIVSSYNGNTDKATYSDTYESRGTGNVDWSDYYKQYIENNDLDALLKAVELALKQVLIYESAAASMDGYLALIDSASGTIQNLANTVGLSTGSKGGGGSSNDTKKDYLAELTSEKEKYHDVNREIEYYDYLIKKADNDVKNAKNALELLEAQAKKVQLLSEKYELLLLRLKEALSYVILDLEIFKLKFGDLFKSAGLDFNFDEESFDLINSEELESYLSNRANQIILTANEWIESYNNLSAEEKDRQKEYYDNYKELSENAQEDIKTFLSLLKEYESDVDYTRLTDGLDELKSAQKQYTEYTKEALYEEVDNLETINDRYHLITREIEELLNAIDDLSDSIERTFGTKRLTGFISKLNELKSLILNVTLKFNEALSYLLSDLQSVYNAGINLDIDKTTGQIKNYNEVIKGLSSEYEAYYNSVYLPFMQEWNDVLYEIERNGDNEAALLLETRKEAIETHLNNLKSVYEHNKDLITQYEETLDVIQEMRDKWEELLKEIEDTKLEQIKYKLDVVFQVHDVEEAAREFSKTIAESIGDALNHGQKAAKIGAKNAKEEAALYSNYLEQYNSLKQMALNAKVFEDGRAVTDILALKDQMEELQGKIIDSGESLLEWVDNIKNLVPDAIDAASERFAAFTDQLEHNSSILDLVKELYTLLGVSIKTEEGYRRLRNTTREKYETALSTSLLQKEWMEGAKRELDEAEEALAEATEGTVLYDILKGNRDALLEQFKTAQTAYLTAAKEAYQEAQNLYDLAMLKAQHDAEKLVTEGLGFDLQQDKYDHYIEELSRYLDNVNELYEVNKWNLKLLEAIDKATTNQLKERLKALQEEIDLRRQGQTLFKYDLEILNAKYEMTLKLMALEDILNTKNQLKLVRDSNGNWNYQYVADEDLIASAKLEFLDAENNYYNIAKQQVLDTSSEIISTTKEMYEKLGDLRREDFDSDEEYEASREEIKRYYLGKIEDLERLLNEAIIDMNLAALTSLLTFTTEGESSIIDMKGNIIPVIQDFSSETIEIFDDIERETGIKLNDIDKQMISILSSMGVSSDEIFNAIKNGGIQALYDMGQTMLSNLVLTGDELADIESDWKNDFAETLGPNGMTGFVKNLKENVDNYINLMDNNWDDYQEKIKEVGEKTGTTLEELDDVIGDVSESTDEFRDAGLTAAESLWEQISAAQEASLVYSELAEEIWDVVEALEELASSTAVTIENWSDGIGVGDLVVSMTPTIDSKYYDDLDWSNLITNAILGGASESTISLLESIRALSPHWGTKSADLIWKLNSEIRSEANKLKELGITHVDYAYSTFKNNEKTWQEWLKEMGISFDTGGYTGEFEGDRLGILHLKELILNKEDTSNILSAVAAVRSIGPDLFAQIEKVLDGNALGAISALVNKLSINVPDASGVVEQDVKIEAVFPNVTQSNEIQDALTSLVNDAAQFARRRTD